MVYISPAWMGSCRNLPKTPRSFTNFFVFGSPFLWISVDATWCIDHRLLCKYVFAFSANDSELPVGWCFASLEQVQFHPFHLINDVGRRPQNTQPADQQVRIETMKGWETKHEQIHEYTVLCDASKMTPPRTDATTRFCGLFSCNSLPLFAPMEGATYTSNWTALSQRTHFPPNVDPHRICLHAPG